MTGQSPVLLAPEVDARRRRVNGPEIALWIIGILLLAISATLVYGFITLIFNQTSNPGQPQDDVGFFDTWVQSSTLFSPGLVTGGIVCIALALLLRGLDINARHRDARLVSLPVDPGPAQVQSVSQPVAQQAQQAQQAQPAPHATEAPEPTAAASVDYAAFMRPSDNSIDLEK
jgi:hypothetical protein